MSDNIPVTDVDQVFPAMVDRNSPGREVATRGGDVGPVVNAALRDVLGWRPRVEDPKAFVEALTASFRLTVKQGHIESEYIARGYAVQSDLGAVTGGQASLYRRAQISRVEILRILDGLTPLRPDADSDDMESYRTIIRGAIESLVVEMGAAGGPRVQMVDTYFLGLTGEDPDRSGPAPAAPTPDQVRGQLGALRDRFGLTDGNVNTVEEEGIRTAFWTLTEMVIDLQWSWSARRTKFSGAAGQGFLGTELILLSRLMEATVDQVEELEAVLDSVLITLSERRTIILNRHNGLTLDGLLSWLRSFLTREARTIAQDTGRDGIVAVLAPTTIKLVKIFTESLFASLTNVGELVDRDSSDVRVVSGGMQGPPAAKVGPRQEGAGHDALVNPLSGVKILPTELEVINTGSFRRMLPAGTIADLPAGMFAARTRVAVGSLQRLLLELARTANRIGRYPGVVLLDVMVQPVSGRESVKVTVRGFNLRAGHTIAFLKADIVAHRDAEDYGPEDLIFPFAGSSSGDDDSVAGFFDSKDFPHASDTTLIYPAEELPVVILDRETGRIVVAPNAATWPHGARSDRGVQRGPDAWGAVRTDWDDALSTALPLEDDTDPDGDD